MNQQPIPTGQIVLPVDKEHGGIQFAIPLVMLAAGLLSYWIVDSWLLSPLLGGGDWDSFRPFLRIVAAVVLGLVIGGLVEVILKRSWGSGKRLVHDGHSLTAEDKAGGQARVEWNKRVNLLLWRYSLRGFPRGGRERRIPTGHHLLACRLVQDETSIVAFCFASPQRAKEMPGYEGFVQIEMASLYHSNPLRRLGQPQRPSIPPSLLAGGQGQVWLAEKERWWSGFELEPAEFSQLMDLLQRHAATPHT